MNILLISDYYPPSKIGGVGEIVKELKQSYLNKGHNVYVLTSGKSLEKDVYSPSNNLIISLIVNNFYSLYLIKKFKIDIIHSHQGSSTLFYITKYVMKNFPKIIHSYQVSYVSEFKNIKMYTVLNKKYRPTFYEYIEKYVFAPIHIIFDTVAFQLADIITVPSLQNQTEITKHYALGRKQQTPHVVPNGYRGDEDEVVLKLNKNQRLNFLYLGVLRCRKGIFHLLSTFHYINKRYQLDFHLEIVGGGRNYEKLILDTINNLKLKDRVTFLGPLSHEESIHKINSSDVMCLFSFYEGMPVTLFEGIASKKPYIASDLFGIRDVYNNINFGLTINPANIKESAEKINKFINNYTIRKVNLKDYRWDIIADKYLELNL